MTLANCSPSLTTFDFIFVAKKRSFEHKRKAHYNEFMAVKLARQLMQNDEEDVESTEEERVETIASNNDPEAEKPIELSENDAEGDSID